jgi:hypothetical protein
MSSLGYVGNREGEEWVYFHWAADKIGDKLAIPPTAAKARLRKLCASGEIRSMMSWEHEEPESISPTQWREEDVDLTAQRRRQDRWQRRQGRQAD